MEREAVRVVVVRDDQLLVMKRNKFGQEYYTLIGGHIEPGEEPQAAMLREVDEETGLTLANPKLVYWQKAYGQYNKQYIFTADYMAGEIQMRDDADETALNAAGQNTYHPLWLLIAQLAEVKLIPSVLRDRLVQDLKQGFPEQPTTLTPKGTE